MIPQVYGYVRNQQTNRKFRTSWAKSVYDRPMRAHTRGPWCCELLVMSRRRYLSTDISTDGKVNQLSDQAALLFTWAIPHFADDCRLTPQNAVEIRLTIVPGRNWTTKHIEGLMNEIFSLGLWGRDENGQIYTPSDSFYKFQTYINAANRRETPQIAASPSLSPSPSLKEDKNKTPPSAAFVLPVWIKKITWDGFEEMRKKERHPLTDKARQLIVVELEKLRELGHNPNESLERSIVNSWRGVFPPKESGSGKAATEADLDRILHEMRVQHGKQ